MFRIEFILKESTKTEIFETWADAGKINNWEKGHFIFDRASDYDMDTATIAVKANGSHYIYNLSDFYRIKITEIK